MKVKKVKNWCDATLTPLAWQRILIRLLPEFRQEGYFLHNINDESTLSESLLAHINRTLSDLYQINLPTQLK